MNRLPRLLPSLALALICAAATAQTPVNPPPWWGINDEVTVSIAWDFDTPFAGNTPPSVPDVEIVPSWYSNPNPWTVTGNMQHLASLNGHTGVFALVSTGAPASATVDLHIDNDPHLDWIKIFWFQFDQFGGSDVGQVILEQLNKYGRASVTETVESLGQGWERVTVSAELIPQPDDEEIDWTLDLTGAGTLALDNLFVNSKCIKPRADEDGEPLGKVMNQQNIDLGQQTGGRVVRALAVTRPSAANPRRFWAAALAPTPTSPHEILELTSLGAPTGNVTVLPSTLTTAPLGPMDMAVERLRQPAVGILQEYVYVLVRLSTGDLAIRAIDANANGAFVAARSYLIPAALVPFSASQRLGLAFDPTGDDGFGSFWITGQTGAGLWRALEFSRPRPGQPNPVPLDFMNVPAQTVSLEYDEALGMFYAFTAEPIVTPSGTLCRVNGVEISGYTGLETGVRFCGDRNIGGTASGMTVYRTLGQSSELRFACVADANNTQFYYELGGPFRYGYSRFGTIGMQGGPPFLGGSFDVTLRGVPNSVLAVLFLGNASANVPITPAPLQSEAIASLIPTVSSAPLPPVATGEFALNIALPPTPTLAYAEQFFQWVVLDSTAPGLLGFTQAGKTVLYP